MNKNNFNILWRAIKSNFSLRQCSQTFSLCCATMQEIKRFFSEVRDFKLYYRVLMVFLLQSALLGCGLDATWPDLEKEILSYIKPIARHPDTYKSPAVFVFSAFQFRSPFEPFGEGSGGQTNPLLSWPLSSLQFTGTVVGSHAITGFIMAPDNHLYQVKQGDLVGNRKGQIILIDSGKIVVREVQDTQGSASPDTTVILRLKGAD